MIEKAVEALKKNDFETALQVLLEAWRTTFAPSLAEAIEQVTTLSNRGSLTAQTREQRLVEWDKVNAKKKAIDVTALVEALPGFRVADAAARLKKLTERGSDPRLTDALLVWFREPPKGLAGPGASEFWLACTRTLRLMKDPRVLAAVPSLRKRWKGDQRQAIGRFMHMRLPWLLEDGVGWKAQPFDASALAAVLTPATVNKNQQASTQKLLQAVYRDPHNLALRQVYADALLEQGDPRGEFISLQLAGTLTAAQRKRVAALRKKHERAWRGPSRPRC